VENPFARALLQGTFKPGDTVVADADPTSGTIVFSAGDRSVVAEASDRRDARSAPDLEPAGARAGGGGALDLPPIDDAKRKDGGPLVN
jgi:hypothetical protein